MTVPALLLVQAASRGWTGNPELCTRLVEGCPIFLHTARKLQDTFPTSPVVIIAPAFDKDGPFSAMLTKHGVRDVRIVYAHNTSPLLRILDASAACSDDQLVLRINGLNLYFHPRVAQEMAATAEDRHLDCYKMADDYPAQLALDIYRVGALRLAARQLVEENEYHVHIKHYMAKHSPPFLVESYPRTLYYTDDEMRHFKETMRGLGLEHTDVKEQSRLSHGDQLTLHYELAMRSMAPGRVVLEIACGNGFGAQLLSKTARRVVAGDIDSATLEIAKTRYGNTSNISFQLLDALATDLPTDTFDYITSFETIEHVPDVGQYLRELARVLKPGGLIFISTPQNCFGKVPLEYWHRVEYSAAELKALIEIQFNIVDFIGIKQGRIIVPGDIIGNNSFVTARSRK